jgi:hypothetical protein
MEFLPAAADDFVSDLLSVKIAAAFWIFFLKTLSMSGFLVRFLLALGVRGLECTHFTDLCFVKLSCFLIYCS